MAPALSCIVVGYDGSTAAKGALEHAARDAAGGATVVIVTAFEPPPEWLGSPFDQNSLDEHRGQAEALLREAAAHPAFEGVTIETELLGGHPAEAITRVAETRDADEIVVGSRGFGPVRGALGSVAYRVLHHANRTVVVVPERSV